MNPDYYRNLGVLDDAEDVVIRAAYRALAQRYHPDKWQGDATEATRRMQRINEAYGILSDSVKRRHYDLEISEAISAGRNKRGARADAENSEESREETNSQSSYSAAKGHQERAGRGPAREKPNREEEPLMVPVYSKGERLSFKFVLGAASVFTVIGLPYFLFVREFSVWMSIWICGCAASVGHWAYIRLFYPELVALEKLEEAKAKKGRKNRIILYVGCGVVGALILTIWYIVSITSKGKVVQVEDIAISMLFGFLLGVVVGFILELVFRFFRWIFKSQARDH